MDLLQKVHNNNNNNIWQGHANLSYIIIIMTNDELEMTTSLCILTKFTGFTNFTENIPNTYKYPKNT